MKRHSVNPNAFGPGSEDILVVFADEETGQLHNVPLRGQKSLKKMYTVQEGKEQDQAKLRGEYDVAVNQAVPDAEVLNNQKKVAELVKTRAQIDDQAFAAAEVELAKPEAVPLDQK